MEDKLNISLKEKNSITNRPNKQAKEDKWRKGTKIQENWQNQSVNGGNDHLWAYFQIKSICNKYIWFDKNIVSRQNSNNRKRFPHFKKELYARSFVLHHDCLLQFVISVLIKTWPCPRFRRWRWLCRQVQPGLREGGCQGAGCHQGREREDEEKVQAGAAHEERRGLSVFFRFLYWK